MKKVIVLNAFVVALMFGCNSSSGGGGGVVVSTQTVTVVTQQTMTVPQQLAGGVWLPGDMAQDDANIYYAKFTWFATPLYSIASISKTSVLGENSIVTVATSTGFPNAVAVDDTSVYWADSGTNTINKINKDGSGSIVTLASGTCQLYGMIVSDGYLYWTDGIKIWQIQTNGEQLWPVPIVSSANVRNRDSFTVYNGNIYWTDTVGIYQMSVNGGAVTPLVEGQYEGNAGEIFSITVNQSGVYWFQSSYLAQYPQGTALTNAIQKYDFKTGQITTLAIPDTILYYGCIASNNEYVYWLTSSSAFFYGGAIHKVNISGGHMITVAAGFRPILYSGIPNILPTYIVKLLVDENSVYFGFLTDTNSTRYLTGSIYEAPK